MPTRKVIYLNRYKVSAYITTGADPISMKCLFTATGDKLFLKNPWKRMLLISLYNLDNILRRIFAMNTIASNESTIRNNSLNASIIKDLINDHFHGLAYENEIVSFALVGLYVPVLFLGIFGNGCLAIIILTKHPLRSVTNLLICSLALADLAGKKTNHCLFSFLDCLEWKRFVYTAVLYS